MHVHARCIPLIDLVLRGTPGTASTNLALIVTTTLTATKSPGFSFELDERIIFEKSINMSLPEDDVSSVTKTDDNLLPDNDKKLKDFYAEHSVDELLNTSLPYRFVRLNPRFDEQETLRKLKVRSCVQYVHKSTPWISRLTTKSASLASR